MKFLPLTGLIIFGLVKAILTAFGAPTLSPPRLPPAACAPLGSSGHVKVVPYSLDQHDVVGSNPLHPIDLSTVQFDQCDFPFMNYNQGSIRYSHGSPREYFGHIRRGDDCLTVLPHGNGQDYTLSFTACSYVDDQRQLQQWFVFQMSTGTSVGLLSFIGVKNSTEAPYNGPRYSWTVSTEDGQGYLHVSTSATSQYLVYLIPSSIPKGRAMNWSTDLRPNRPPLRL